MTSVISGRFGQLVFLFFLLCVPRGGIFQNDLNPQFTNYTLMATCQNGTHKMLGNICNVNMMSSKYCISRIKFDSTLKKFDDCRLSTKKYRISPKLKTKGSIKPDYRNLQKRLWKRQVTGAETCDAIKPPKPGKVTCRIFGRGMDCIGICDNGYRFSDGSLRKIHRCYDGGPWVPDISFLQCKPQCIPKCQNGGTCVEVNFCACPTEFRGETCQYPLSLCGISKTSSASSWQCNHSKSGSICKIACHPPGSIEADSEFGLYYCTVGGFWQLPLPSCVSSSGGKICPNPGTIPNSHFDDELDDIEHFLPGKILFFSCLEDYLIEGAEVIHCQPNGSWSAPKPNCVHKKTLCPAVVSPQNAEIRLFFPDAETLRTHLVFNKENSSQDNAVNDPTSIRTFPPGAKIQYKCRSRFYKLYGSEYQTCHSNGVWSGNKPVCLPDCGKSESPRHPLIVGGNASEAGMWPWQVSLSIYQSDHEDKDIQDLVCGATLISDKWIVTAAHCVTVQHSTSSLTSGSVIVHLGKHFRENALDDQYVQTRKVRRIVIHEDYDFVKFEADIALIELEGAVELTVRVQPICLPSERTTRDNIQDGHLGVVTGWGLTEDGIYSKELRETVLPVVSREFCEKSYQQGLRSIIVSERMICAGGGPSDTCNGDSGGPFVFLDPQSPQTWVLEGIVSWGSGAGCGRTGEYSGFTKVVRFVDWIKTFL